MTSIIHEIPTPFNKYLEKIRDFDLVLSDGYKTSVLYIPAKIQPKVNFPVIYAHGIQSHPGWFLDSAAFLAENGFDVYFLTRRGNGFHTKDRGHAKSPKQLFDDLDVSIKAVLEHSNTPKAHLVGISWGGKLLCGYGVKRPNSDFIASINMITPGLAAQIDVSLKTKLAVAAGLFFKPSIKLDIPLSDPELFTDNERIREFLRDDPQRLHRATAKFMYTSRLIDKILASASGGSINVPASLILSSKDKIIDNEKTAALVKKLTSKKAKIIELEGSHTLEFEPDNTTFKQTLLEILK